MKLDRRFLVKVDLTDYGDFDNDKKIEFVTFAIPNASNNATKQKINFHLYEIDKQIGTGPNYSTDTAEQGAPGF